MRKLVLVLGIATTGLALACGYLSLQLEHERSRNEALVVSSSRESSPAVAAAANDNEPLREDDAVQEHSAPAVRQAAEGSASASDSTARAQRRAEQRAELQQRWSDPGFRARALLQRKYQARRENSDVGTALRLSASEEAAFIALLAQQRLQIEEASEPMRFATDAERASIQQEIARLDAQHLQELAEHLGPRRYQEYQEFQQRIPERQQLRQLRSRLDEANSLTTAQSSRLLEAMYQERDSYLQQIQSLENLGSYSPQYPIQAFPKSRDPAVRVRFAEEQVALTEAFQGRLRLRAAEVLNAEQLRRFDEIQEEQLTMVQSRVERIRNQAKRRGARERRPPQ